MTRGQGTYAAALFLLLLIVFAALADSKQPLQADWEQQARDECIAMRGEWKIIGIYPIADGYGDRYGCERK